MANWKAALAHASAAAAVAADHGRRSPGLLELLERRRRGAERRGDDDGARRPPAPGHRRPDLRHDELPVARGLRRNAHRAEHRASSFCTLYCGQDTDCPSGTVCDTAHTHHADCLKSCTADTDCSGGFACAAGRAVDGTAQKVCWSPYSGADAVLEAGGGGVRRQGKSGPHWRRPRRAASGAKQRRAPTRARAPRPAPIPTAAPPRRRPKPAATDRYLLAGAGEGACALSLASGFARSFSAFPK